LSSDINQEVVTAQVIRRAAVPLLITWLFISMSFLIPLINSTVAPYFDLTGLVSQFAYVLAFTGGKFGAPFVALLMLMILVTRYGIDARRKLTEIVIIISTSLVLAGGGAAINEHMIKAEFKIPRPNIVWLAEQDTVGSLGMTAQQFYELGNKQVRREPLLEVLNFQPSPVLMSESVKQHWVEETGYSFPSGHAFSAMFFASFFLFLAVSSISGKRLWWFYLLAPWALMVCYSRTILRVHTPTDITVGGLQGLVFGVLAWLIARSLIRRFN